MTTDAEQPRRLTEADPATALPAAPASTARRVLWLTSGSLALGLGLIGLVVPLLPTTPLLLVTAACWARSSPRAYGWLLRHRTLGPPIERWRSTRTIAPGAKWTAVALVFAAFASSVLLVPNCAYGYLTLFVVGSLLVVFLAGIPTVDTRVPKEFS